MYLKSQSNLLKVMWLINCVLVNAWGFYVYCIFK